MRRVPLPNAEVYAARLGRGGKKDWLKVLPECIEDAGPFAFVFDTEPPLYVRNLMDTLGVDVIVDSSKGRMEVVRL